LILNLLILDKLKNAIDEIFTMVEKIIEKFGRIDILINNAGILGKAMKPMEITDEEWDRVLDVNLKGAFIVTQEVLKYMKKIDDSFNHVLCYRAHEDRSREPFFQEILKHHNFLILVRWQCQKVRQQLILLLTKELSRVCFHRYLNQSRVIYLKNLFEQSSCTIPNKFY